jgi:DNA-binding response OmpR family regulator
MRIAVLEDDSPQSDFICQTLSAAGHTCYAFSTGPALAKELRHQTFDLLVLDWQVPGMSGEEVLRWVRLSLTEPVPVLFMTSRSLEADIAMILNAGADDYIVKPVSVDVLLARVRSLLRRAYQSSDTATTEVFGEFTFDLKSKLVLVRGTPVTLMHKQFELALLLFQNMDRPLSRSYIRDVVWNQVTDTPSRTIDTHVSSLRAKLGLRPENGYRLSPVYGYGYRLEMISEQNW